MIPAARAKQVHTVNPVEILLNPTAGRPKDTAEEASLEPSVHGILETGNGCCRQTQIVYIIPV